MKTIRFTVPATRNVGSYSGTCSASYGETLAQSALWDYNSCRAHDGLPPLSRMPAGTVYHTPPPTWYINRVGGGYRETVDQFETSKEARAMLAEYRMGDPAGRYYVSSRPCKGWKDEPAPVDEMTADLRAYAVELVGRGPVHNTSHNTLRELWKRWGRETVDRAIAAMPEFKQPCRRPYSAE